MSKCASRKLSTDGIRHNHKQIDRCNECGRQFVENPSGHYRISEETRRVIIKPNPDNADARSVAALAPFAVFFTCQRHVGRKDFGKIRVLLDELDIMSYGFDILALA